MTRHRTTLTELARLGFSELSSTATALEEAAEFVAVESLLPVFASCANPDQALRLLVDLLRQAPSDVTTLFASPGGKERLLHVLGASTGFGEYFLRHPEELAALRKVTRRPLSIAEYRKDLLSAALAEPGNPDDAAWNALRVRYRRHLVRLTSFDLEQNDPLQGLDVVTTALANLAGAALDASLAVARTLLPSPQQEVAATRLAIVGMGKAGAAELNYVSDVDVIFVAAGAGELASDRAVEIATRLAILTMRGIHDFAKEPPLWEVDANLRPEGKDGALVRTLESHLAYYDRWAKGWEFQALLKARPLAGDLELGESFCTALSPQIWSSASRENFVEGVQRMRERVTANIPNDELEFQLKLGPGGLRDVEFTVQLLQLVHGQMDVDVRQAGTLPALAALAEHGYIGRAEAAEFASDYRFLRLLEHRLQLAQLRRTHLMPSDRDALRALARATGLTSSAEDLSERWARTKLAVRSLHERLFYRPLLAAVASLPEEEFALSSEQAAARLAAIGFRDAKGALGHIAALSSGVSRRAEIQRHLLPVMLQWFSDGADPDYGLLAFRRLSDALGESHWFLRMLRDSSGAAKRLTNVLAGSRFVGMLMERIPEAAAWLENEDELRPRRFETLRDEALATVARHSTADAAAPALRTARRREVLRLALASVLDVIDVRTLGQSLSDVTTALLTGTLATLHRESDGLEFAIIAMGRYGGQELGFGSDADVIYVYRATSLSGELAQARAEVIVSELLRLTEDLVLPLDLDINLRPEGKNGAVVRSLHSYRAYYERWSLTWEAQALLRSRAAAGDQTLRTDFEALADEVRFPAAIADRDVREVKRIKARVESERLPQGADPARHLKLGRGSLSDVEWLVQLLQLQHGAAVPALRTTSTLDALAVAVTEGFLSDVEEQRLADAWIFASRARSAVTLWTAKTLDVLPTDRRQLDGIARLMGYPSGSATALDDDYLRVTRLARTVFEKRFYGTVEVRRPATE
ncbi:MAG: bifunctional [glutamine synthetase] adenylyltransferase/[glutamine synthetase]-adenylyl-L-tyrosine phosphorylase [Lacisediminihabitans sp.]